MRRLVLKEQVEGNMNDIEKGNGSERFSRRLENGVEILEHETIRTITINGDRYETAAIAVAPRLVVGDTRSRAELFIAKTRSDIRDLDTFLRSVVHSPLTK